MVIIEPSVLSADYARLGQQAREAQQAGAMSLSIDIMDGQFVPNITFGADMVRMFRREVNIKLDVHLMIIEPEHHLPFFARAGADRIIVHWETCPHIHRTLDQIRECGCEAGIALNPGTPAALLDEVLHKADLIQVMTVNPGFGGQAFIHSQLKKVEQIKQSLLKIGHDIPIYVDGGIDVTTAPLAAQAGATVLVAGSSVYNDRASVVANMGALLESIRSVTSGK
jgi:ribulose-phosphate 3-epimerase